MPPASLCVGGVYSVQSKMPPGSAGSPTHLGPDLHPPTPGAEGSVYTGPVSEEEGGGPSPAV